jgi:Asp-tRNA(Asn)/Glu-tRNA(Gln) amidotransferase A subunit family amidase
VIGDAVTDALQRLAPQLDIELVSVDLPIDELAATYRASQPRGQSRQLLDGYLRQWATGEYRSADALLATVKDGGVLARSLDRYSEKTPPTSAQVAEYAEAQRRLRARIEALMKNNDLDGLVYPTVRSYPVPVAVYQSDADVWNCVLSSYSGLPAVTIPLGLMEATRTPFGMTVLGHMRSDDRLMEFAGRVGSLQGFVALPASAP